jgi:hypothetical protein
MNCFVTEVALWGNWRAELLMQNCRCIRRKGKRKKKWCMVYCKMMGFFFLFLILNKFGCAVAKQAWSLLTEVIGFNVGLDYKSMAKCWLCNTRFGVVNILSSAVCWGL